MAFAYSNICYYTEAMKAIAFVSLPAALVP